MPNQELEKENNDSKNQDLDWQKSLEFQEKMAEHEHALCMRLGIDTTNDHAALICRLVAARADRYSPDNDDPVLGPVIRKSLERYQELRNHGFGFALRISQTEAIRNILSLDLDIIAKENKTIVENTMGI